MSKVSTVYDRMLAALGEEFPSLTRIPNPYLLEENNDNFLRNGFGLKVGAGAYTPFEFCSYVISRRFSVVFTRELFRVDSSPDKADDVIKELLENVKQVQDLFYAHDELGIPESILKVDITDVSEIGPVASDKFKFLTVECSFDFHIKEDL
jgi:hypothetical protein